MFSLLLKLSLLWRLNVLSVALTASRVRLNFLLLPEVCHVLAALVFAELSDTPLGSGGPSINCLLELPCGHWIRFSLYPPGRDRDILTSLPSSLDPWRRICAGFPVCFPHQSHFDFLSGDKSRHLMPTCFADSGRCSTLKVVLSLLFLFSCQGNKKEWVFISRGSSSQCKVLIITSQDSFSLVSFSILPIFVYWGSTIYKGYIYIYIFVRILHLSPKNKQHEHTEKREHSSFWDSRPGFIMMSPTECDLEQIPSCLRNSVPPLGKRLALADLQGHSSPGFKWA